MAGDKAKVLLFAGTTEGRLLAEYLEKIQCPAIVCVATEYGRDLLAYHIRGGCLDIRWGRLDAEAMEALLLEERPGLVIDATHPYAVQVTENLQKACAGKKGVRYVRCLRDEEKETLQEESPQIVHVPDIEGAVSWLALREGNILAATGGKELAAYCRINDYRERVYARVLPSQEAVSACVELGFRGRHIIAMQGPFSREMNLALLKEFQCHYLVTKDGGRNGGMREKLEAAALAGAAVVILDRPDCGEGISLEETKRLLEEWMEHD